VGFEVFVIDPRRAFLSPEAFPDAARILEAWPDEGLEEVGLDRFASVVVLAHDRKLDLPALEAALRSGCRFVGQIGGKRTQRLRREALADLGFEESQIARVRGPVGLDIGSDTPEEIALAILAEIVAVQHGRA
jgi:xanthine dehydrogenase accessory factor